MRFHIVMLKTLKDLFSTKRSLVFLIISLIPVFIFANVSQREAVFNFKVMTLPMQIQMMNGIFIIMSFIWIAGIPLVLLAAMTCGSFISKEEQDGTLLLLASKPIRRYEIIIGKFFAFLVSTMILELIAFLLAPLLTFNLLDLDPSALTSMLNMVPSLYLYSLFVTFVFGAISATLS
ncbi:MAG: ABC transporter permease, partial [Candidatus Heimdallarchaeaceae archaeon]